MKITILLVFATFVVSSMVSPKIVSQNTNFQHFQALTDSQKEKLERIGKPCQEESGISDDLRSKLLETQFIDDPKLKKHLFCMWKKLGLANEDGEIVEDKLHERVKAAAANEEEAEKICEKCKKIRKDTPEERFFEVTKCLNSELPNFSPVE